MPAGRKQSRFSENQELGEWTLLRYRPGQKGVLKPTWLCQCSCGVTRWVNADNLANGSSRSCGHRTNRYQEVRVAPVNSVFALADSLL